MNNNSLYITPALKVLIVDLGGVLCQSNGAKYNPTEEVTGVEWEDD